MNQCDGCRAGIPVVDGKHQMGPKQKYSDYMVCTKDKYVEPSIKLFLDQDGVLADFDARKREVFGTDHVPDGILWNVINKYFPKYFEELLPMGGMRQLWDFCRSFNPTILTAIPKININQIDEQKRQWVWHWLGEEVPMIFCRRIEKQNYCTGPDCVLIDDNHKNCKEWRDKGGKAIQHVSAEKSIVHLKHFILLLQGL